MSLHIMSQPFLQPLSTSVLSKFATAYYAEAKHIETKSDQNYVSKSVKGLGFLLQGLPEVEQSEGFKALRNDFTIDLEKFRMSIMQNYVFPVNDMNVEAKRHQFHIALCKLLRGLATIYIAQCGITGYSEDVAIADLITIKNDTILVPVNLNTKQFLKVYVKAHGIQVFPKPSINNNISNLIDEINGAGPVRADSAPEDAGAGRGGPEGEGVHGHGRPAVSHRAAGSQGASGDVRRGSNPVCCGRIPRSEERCSAPTDTVGSGA